MTTYYCDFENKTNQTWTMAVYQELPSSVGLDSVSWKQTTVPQSGNSGVNWDIFYNVAMANYTQNGGIGVYKSNQVLPADLGTAWNIVFKDSVQQLEPAGGASQANQIEVYNKSNLLANPGIGMSGEGSVFKNSVLSGASAQFTVTPKYYVGLFNQLQIGEVISSNVVVGPLELVYPTGNNKATLTASISGNNIELSLAYTVVQKVALAQIEEKQALLAAC